jgi:hypothetical protein
MTTRCEIICGDAESAGYNAFLSAKRHLGGRFGFSPTFMPDSLFDFQRLLVSWAVERGRSAIFADCGLGKTAIQLTWAENVVRHANRPVLVLTPLAVGAQTVREAFKFGMECVRSFDGSVPSGARIVVANYQRLHHFNPQDFCGIVCDESSILKNFDGATKAAVTEFARKLPFRLLCTATAAPNDYIELGTSSEALGELGFSDMISRFFKKQGPTTSRKDEHRAGVYRFRGHAERDFWRWVCSWARAVRKPSDLGCDDNQFRLPDLITREHVVTARRRKDGMLFDLPAMTLEEQREERRRTIEERCELVASLVSATKEPAVLWCHLNDEGKALARIPGAVEVAGDDADERKEEVFEAFASGQVRVLVTKPSIAGWGLNWQHCAHETFFPSHSFEQWYQAVRRCWRFGQKRTVTVDVVASEGEAGVLSNLKRKSDAADRMFAQLVDLMNNELRIEHAAEATTKPTIPSWLSKTKL